MLSSGHRSNTHPSESVQRDRVHIRDRIVAIDDLVPALRLSDVAVQALADEAQSAKPYCHLVVESWFSPSLLDLIHEEFDLRSAADVQPNLARHEQTHRLAAGARLGPATALYFGIVNSGPFVELLSRVTGLGDLISDPSLHGGGLHETRHGGRFGIHRDFDYHPRTRLENRLVFITYLNKGWSPEWAGALELWDADSKSCVRRIEPEFGRSVLMSNGRRNFHGHPEPLRSPAGVARRSIASYYYTNTKGTLASDKEIGSVFFNEDLYDKSKAAARSVVPPILWRLAKRLVARR